MPDEIIDEIIAVYKDDLTIDPVATRLATEKHRTVSKILARLERSAYQSYRISLTKIHIKLNAICFLIFEYPLQWDEES